jgi:hypothetical protein
MRKQKPYLKNTINVYPNTIKYAEALGILYIKKIDLKIKSKVIV